MVYVCSTNFRCTEQKRGVWLEGVTGVCDWGCGWGMAWVHGSVLFWHAFGHLFCWLFWACFLVRFLVCSTKVSCTFFTVVGVWVCECVCVCKVSPWIACCCQKCVDMTSLLRPYYNLFFGRWTYLTLHKQKLTGKY